MTWEELKEEAKKMGYKQTEWNMADYIPQYRNSIFNIEVLRWRDFYYTKDGDVYYKPYGQYSPTKIKHVPYCEGYEKMLAIMKALQ